MFWGATLLPGEPYLVSSPGPLTISCAMLSEDAKEGSRCVVSARGGEVTEWIVICSLKKHVSETFSLRITVQQNEVMEMRVEGDHPVYLTGVLEPRHERRPSDEKLSSQYMMQTIFRKAKAHAANTGEPVDVAKYMREHGMSLMDGASDDDEDDDDDDDDDDEEEEDDEEVVLGKRGAKQQQNANATTTSNKASKTQAGATAGADKKQPQQNNKAPQADAKPQQSQQNKTDAKKQAPAPAQQQQKPPAVTPPPKQAEKKPEEKSKTPPPLKVLGNGLEIQDVVVGTGAEATRGKTIVVGYFGKLTNGKKFDSNSNFRFRLGAGDVIQGWDQGFAGMKVGGKRRLKIPPKLGYGGSRTGPIPPNSTLLFDVELKQVLK